MKPCPVRDTTCMFTQSTAGVAKCRHSSKPGDLHLYHQLHHRGGGSRDPNSDGKEHPDTYKHTVNVSRFHSGITGCTCTHKYTPTNIQSCRCNIRVPAVIMEHKLWPLQLPSGTAISVPSQPFNLLRCGNVVFPAVSKCSMTISKLMLITPLDLMSCCWAELHGQRHVQQLARPKRQKNPNKLCSVFFQTNHIKLKNVAACR